MKLFIPAGLASLDSDDTIWSALSWSIAGQSSRRRKRSPQNPNSNANNNPGNSNSDNNPGNGNGQNNGSTESCTDADCDGQEGLLWERHQTRGDTVDYSYEPNTFTSIVMTKGQAGLYVPDDNMAGIGLIEPHAIMEKNDKHYVVCMHACV